MVENDFLQKMLFGPFFPFGYCSKLATTIAGKNNREAARFLLGENPEEQFALCDQSRQRVLYKARCLVQKGYVQDTQRVCGTPAKKRSFRHITKAGVNILVEHPDGIIMDGDDLEAFDDILLNAVIDGKVTPFSYAIDFIDNIKISTEKYSPNQLYNIWRLSHINAMFMVNGYLTLLDRRPYDTGFAFDGITDEESFNAYVQKYGYTLPAITHYALSRWYNANPGFYQISQMAPDYSDIGKQEWLETPAFYSAKELPSASSRDTITTDANAKGSKQTMMAIYVGLATGRNVNYACYHAKNGPFNWNQKREKEAKESLENAIAEMKKQNSEIPYRDTVDFALYFCSSVHQFVAFFERTKKKHIKFQEVDLPISKPYASVHVIPVNDSGGFLHWCLMEFSPDGTESKIHQTLVNSGMGFQYNRFDPIFPLMFQEKWVFSGYTMDLRKINRALEKRLDGFDFYLCCFPDQVSWYKKIFGDITIL